MRYGRRIRGVKYKEVQGRMKGRGRNKKRREERRGEEQKRGKS